MFQVSNVLLRPGTFYTKGNETHFESVKKIY